MSAAMISATTAKAKATPAESAEDPEFQMPGSAVRRLLADKAEALGSNYDCLLIVSGLPHGKV